MIMVQCTQITFFLDLGIAFAIESMNRLNKQLLPQITFLLGIGFALGANGVTLAARFGNPHGDVVMCALVTVAITLFYIAFGRVGIYVNVVCDTDLKRRMSSGSVVCDTDLKRRMTSGSDLGERMKGRTRPSGTSGSMKDLKDVDAEVDSEGVDLRELSNLDPVIGDEKSKSGERRPSQTKLIVS